MFLLGMLHLVRTQNFLWEWHFLPPDAVKVRVCIWEWEMLILLEILRAYSMDGLLVGQIMVLH